MAGIFGGHLFDGLGQTTTATTPLPDAASDELISTLATTGGSSTAPKTGGGTAYMPAPSKSGSAMSTAYMPPSPTYAAPASDNTVLYVVGGVAAVGLLAVIMMSGGRRGGTVTANRGKRGRRSRHRRSR